MKTSELQGAALDWAVANALYGHTRPTHMYKYSTDWAKGGPIIERERIALAFGKHDTGVWWAGKFVGPTPLIAAMRCYVASKLGDEVEIPEELK